MKKTESNLTKTEHLEMSRKAREAYHPYYTSFKLKKRPNFHQRSGFVYQESGRNTSTSRAISTAFSTT